MADEGGGTSIFDIPGEMFKNFPIFTLIVFVIGIYVFWRSTGGVERGEARRAAGTNSIFLEVTGVPDGYGNREFFSAVENNNLEEVLSEDAQPSE